MKVHYENFSEINLNNKHRAIHEPEEELNKGEVYDFIW
jgi:hypothetical protein